MKFKLLLCTLLAASAAAFGSPLDIQPNPAAPGGLGAATNEFTSIYGQSMFATSITSSNVDASVINFGDGSQQTTAANPLSFGASSSIGWSFIAGTNSAYVLPYIFDAYNAALNATNKLDRDLRQFVSTNAISNITSNSMQVATVTSFGIVATNAAPPALTNIIWLWTSTGNQLFSVSVSGTNYLGVNSDSIAGAGGVLQGSSPQLQSATLGTPTSTNTIILSGATHFVALNSIYYWNLGQNRYTNIMGSSISNSLSFPTMVWQCQQYDGEPLTGGNPWLLSTNFPAHWLGTDKWGNLVDTNTVGRFIGGGQIVITNGFVYADLSQGTNIVGSNILSGTINSNKFDAATLAMLGTGSQTPWTSDINAAAHNLTNVTKITGTIAFPFLYQPVDPLYGANLSWSIGADDSIPDFILDYNTNSTLLSRFEFTPEGGFTLTGGYSDNGGAYPGTNIFGLPTLLTNKNNTIAGVFYGTANLTNNTATPWNAGSTNDLATKSNVVSAVNALALGAISPGLGISTNGGVVAVTYPTLTNGGSGYSITASSITMSNLLLTGTTAAALVPTMTGPNTPYGQVIDSGPFGAQSQYAGWYAFGGSNFHSYSTNMAWVEYVAPGYLTATGAVITISAGSSTNMVQVSNDGITFTTIYSNNICNNGTAFPFTSTTARYWRFTFPNATTAPQEQIVNGLQLYGLAQAGISLGTNGNVTIGANLNAGSVAASTFTGSLYGNGAGVTNQSVASFAAGGTSTSNNWVGAFTGDGTSLTNQNASYTTKPLNSLVSLGQVSNYVAAAGISTSNNWVGAFTGNGSGLSNVTAGASWQCQVFNAQIGQGTIASFSSSRYAAILGYTSSGLNGSQNTTPMFIPNYGYISNLSVMFVPATTGSLGNSNSIYINFQTNVFLGPNYTNTVDSGLDMTLLTSANTYTNSGQKFLNLNGSMATPLYGMFRLINTNTATLPSSAATLRYEWWHQ